MIADIIWLESRKVHNNWNNKFYDDHRAVGSGDSWLSNIRDHPQVVIENTEPEDNEPGDVVPANWQLQPLSVHQSAQRKTILKRSTQSKVIFNDSILSCFIIYIIIQVSANIL